MIVALTSSFFITWLFIPVLFLLLGVSKKVKHAYHPKTNWVRFFMLRPLVSFLFIGALVAALIIVPRILPSGFLPEMDEGGIVLDYLSPPGTTIEETNSMLNKVDEIVRRQPEVTNFSRRTGTQMGFFITEPNTGDYLIQLNKKRDKTTDEVSDEIRKKIEASIPQLRVDFGQVIGDMLGDLISSVQPVEIKIFGDNENKIEALSQQVAEEISTVRGTADVFDGIITAGPEVSVQPNVAKLAQFGITPTDFQFQLQTQLEGNVIGSILEKEQAIDIRLIYPEARYTTVGSLKNANLFLPDGKLRPLSTVATIEMDKGVAEINRENQKMMGVVTARLEGRDLGSTLKEIQTHLAAAVHLPAGYHIEYGGAYAEQQSAFRELLAIFITAALLVFIVLLVLFREFKISFLIITLALLGAAGCLLALLITGTPLNVGSYCGIIMIIGIIGENAIFTYQQFQQARTTKTPEEAILFSIGTRLRPKLMTAMGAITALLPLALGLGVGAQLHQPLAIAVIGGLVIALPLLLIIFPSMLRLLYKKND
jgi:cobalt-zinc-cadmium resistance protein CzcA